MIMDYTKDNEMMPGSSSQNEGGRGCRSKKKYPACCPVCSVTLRQSDVNIHLNSEIERLNKLPSLKHKLSGRNNGSLENSEKKWEIFRKVKSNRQSRQRMKARKRQSEEICPICKKEVSEDIIIHVELCIRRSEATDSDSDENIDVEAFEEYEWAGQSRVRATSLLEGGISSLGTFLSMTEEDEDLNVDVDDTHMYGSPQYCETDVILSSETPENLVLRKAVIGADPKTYPDRTKSNDILSVETRDYSILEVLKNRIRELESREQNRQMYKCLICMEQFRIPVISVCCWHVHCEECWLQTLGAKKLCPQCNVITSPANLRRIYI